MAAVSGVNILFWLLLWGALIRVFELRFHDENVHMQGSAFQWVAASIFAAALIHTFATKTLERLARRHPATSPSRDRGSPRQGKSAIGTL